MAFLLSFFQLGLSTSQNLSQFAIWYLFMGVTINAATNMQVLMMQEIVSDDLRHLQIIWNNNFEFDSSLGIICFFFQVNFIWFFGELNVWIVVCGFRRISLYFPEMVRCVGKTREFVLRLPLFVRATITFTCLSQNFWTLCHDLLRVAGLSSLVVAIVISWFMPRSSKWLAANGKSDMLAENEAYLDKFRANKSSMVKNYDSQSALIVKDVTSSSWSKLLCSKMLMGSTVVDLGKITMKNSKNWKMKIFGPDNVENR